MRAAVAFDCVRQDTSQPLVGVGNGRLHGIKCPILSAMAKLGRNDPCHCGSGKKYKRCCLEEDRRAAASSSPADPFDEIRNRLEEQLEGKDSSSMEDLQGALAAVMDEMDQGALDDFHGLSPQQMHGLINAPFTSTRLVRVPATLDHEPQAIVVALFRALVDGIGRGIKATARGNLPQKVVMAAAEVWRELYPDDVDWRSSIRREDQFLELHVVRLVAELAGLLETRGGKFSWTPWCEDLLADGGMRSIYPVLLQTFASRFNWGYLDGYDELPGIQHTFMFTLYLLTRYGDTWRDTGFYEDAFLTAFPHVVDEVERHLQLPVVERHRRRRQPPAVEAQRGVPPVVDRRGQRQADLPHHLRPAVQGQVGGLPIGEGQRGPGCRLHARSARPGRPRRHPRRGFSCRTASHDAVV